MLLRVVTPPEDLLSPADLGLTEDDATQRAINAAIQFLGGPNGFMGASLGPQTLELGLPDWTTFYETVLPCGPVIDIVSVVYADENGVDQTLDDSQYRLLRGVLGDVVYFAHDFSSPACRSAPDAVRVRYRAGYDGTVNPELPEPIKTAIGLLASQSMSTGKVAAGSSLKSVEIPGVAIKTYDTASGASAGAQGVVSNAVTNLLIGYIRKRGL